MQNHYKTILSVLFLALFVGSLAWYQKNKDKGAETVSPTPQTPSAPASNIRITSVEIKEANFTGKKPVITGNGVLVAEANKYIESSVAQFKQDADEQVPAMREEFGADMPSANYNLIIEAKYLTSATTESIVLSHYVYTGGANGTGLYQVFSILKGGQEILSFANVIKPNKQTEFTALLKKKLLDWRPQGSTESVVFADVVNTLKFADLKLWSLDEKNLTIYFGEYEIGPGVLGAVPFTIPVSELKDFLSEKVTQASVQTLNQITYTKASADLIKVELPFPGSVTGKDFSVIGQARGFWFFEASFPIELRDANNKLLYTAIATAEGDWMTENFVPFRAEIKAPTSYIGPATMILRKDNASGLPEHDASISFPITVEY